MSTCSSGKGGGAETLPNIAYRVRKVRIDAERARDFDHLMGGPATDLVHPGVLHVLAFPVSLALMARRDFPFPLLGLVVSLVWAPETKRAQLQ